MFYKKLLHSRCDVLKILSTDLFWGNWLMKKTGTVKSFVHTPGSHHGNASVEGEQKRVFLPGAALKVYEPETDRLREFKPGEEKVFPTPRTAVVVEYQAGTRELVASRWGIKP